MDLNKSHIIDILKQNNTSLTCSEILKQLLEKEEFKKQNISPEQIKKIIKEDLKFAEENSYFRISMLNKNSFGLNLSFNLEEYEGLKKISLKKESQDFEKKVKALLEKLEFNDVEGGRDNFIVGGHQVDVCARHENSLLVIECKMSQEIKRKNLRKIICEFRGKINDLKEGFKNIKEYAQIKEEDFRFILLVNENIKFRREDIELANKYPRIHLMSEEALEYYNELYSFLKPYAKFNLLGELRIRPIDQSLIKIPAFKTSYGKGKMYSFLIDPRELIKFSYVARRERGSERYYQRIIKKERLGKIREYLNGGGKFPNNIIISFDDYFKDKINFKGNDQISCENQNECKFGILEFPKDYRSCWIVDGQHRLFSYINSDIGGLIQVSAFEGLDLGEQGKIFLDINKNQKPVPSDLVWDLSGELVPESEDGIISRTVKYLNYEFKSPLFHKIYFPSLGLRKNFSDLLKVAGICISMKRSGFGKQNTKSKMMNPFYNKDTNKFVNKMGKSFSEFFSTVKEVFLEDWDRKNKGFSLDDGGISVLVKIYEKIIKQSFELNFSLSKENYKRYLLPIKKYLDVEWNGKKLNKLKKTYFASESGKERLLEILCLEIREATEEISFGGDIAEDNLKEEISTLERKFGKFLSEILEKVDVNWAKTKIPSDIYSRAIGKLQKKGIHDGREEIHEYFTLGEEKRILEHGKNFNLFEDYFLKNKIGFVSEQLFFGAFDMIIKIRNMFDHGVKGKILIPRDEKKLLEVYIPKILRCIELDQEEILEEE
jgi:DNA sulfur modification protein DndB